MQKFQLQKIDDYRWRIPKTYKPGMRVPGIIYADEKMLQHIVTDNAPDQVANVAFLPGIVKYSLAMPDIHWGYGFCLTKDTKILTNFGYYRPIEDFEENWFKQNLKNIDLNSKKPVEASISRFIKLMPKKVFKIVTKMGDEVKATDDHPLFTPYGMKPIKELKSGDKIAIFPFQGISYEEPPGEIIISEENISDILLKLGIDKNRPRFRIMFEKLRKRDLLPLTYNHQKLPYILKIMGFIFGDGSMNFIGKRGDGVLHFSGKPQDLEEARKDLKKIGYTPSPIHFQRVKSSRNSTKYHDCYSFLVNASSLVVLLEALGVPRGSKVSQAYRVPKWIFKSTLWQKRLFLASLFGCELRIPHRRLDRRGYFNAPVFPMAKREELIENGKDFLEDISKLLKEFGVRTLYIDKRKRHVSKKGDVSWALELLISPKPENLFNLWGKIGFEYNIERSFKANVAVQYLKLKLKILKEKEEAIKVTIPQLLKERLSYQKVALQLAGNPLTKRFITDVCWKLNKGKEIVPRIPFSFPSFEDYLKEVTQELDKSGMVWDDIKTIEKIDYKDFVYDFTVSHSDHNFIANNFVVSNCIGGVAAMDPEAGGVISPGGIGYDINCLVPETKVLLEDGNYMPIAELEKHWLDKKVICIDLRYGYAQAVLVINFIKRLIQGKVYRILTESGQEIKVTGDHPFWTPDGMIPARSLQREDMVAVYGEDSFAVYNANSQGSFMDNLGSGNGSISTLGTLSSYKAKTNKKLSLTTYHWEKIEWIDKIEYNGYVYDLTVNHPSHNFIANSFVVSNCGVRLVRTDLTEKELRPKLDPLVHALFRDVPCGVGEKGQIRLNYSQLKKLAVEGSKWIIKSGYGEPEDLDFTEQGGCMEGADPSTLSPRAMERGLPQSGTLGSGNHFLEVQLVEEIYEPEIANVFGLFKGQITVMIHSGSRGFGYQVCDDSLRYMRAAPQKYGFNIPDRQLACAPINSTEGERYFAEMSCAANYAWANRQVLMYLARLTFEKMFGKGYKALGMRLVYDVTHNIGKFEEYEVNGKRKKLFVHRKGATRAFPKGHPALPRAYKDVGQPVIIPGDMGRNSYVLVGTELAMKETFGSVCHGAGRMMSRTKAVHQLDYGKIQSELKQKGIIVISKGKKSFLEEAPAAYKDINDVVRVVHNSGIARKVAKMRPLGVIKG